MSASVLRPVAGTVRTGDFGCSVCWPSWSIMTRPPRKHRAVVSCQVSGSAPC